MSKKNGSKSGLPKGYEKLALAIGKNVATHREKASVTQAVLAEKVEITPLYVSAIEHGRRLPSLILLVDMSRVLGVTPDALIVGS